TRETVHQRSKNFPMPILSLFYTVRRNYPRRTRQRNEKKLLLMLAYRIRLKFGPSAIKTAQDKKDGNTNCYGLSCSTSSYHFFAFDFHFDNKTRNIVFFK